MAPRDSSTRVETAGGGKPGGPETTLPRSGLSWAGGTEMTAGQGEMVVLRGDSPRVKVVGRVVGPTESQNPNVDTEFGTPEP